MRRCTHCHRLLPESEFTKETRVKDGLRYMCRACSKEYRDDYIQKQKEEQEKLEKANIVLGGYKVSILNHASRNESKYTISGTNGNYFATNDKWDFFNYLKGVV